MDYDEELARRVRDRLGERCGVTEELQTDGPAFLHDGNLAVSVHAEGLVVRVGPAGARTALARPGARPFENDGRAMNGWVLVSASVLVSDIALHDWVDEAHAYAANLPAR